MENNENTNIEVEKELTQEELSELLQIRRDKLKLLQDAGKDPFQIVKYDQQYYSTDILGNFEELEDCQYRRPHDVQAYNGQGELCPSARL